MATVCPQCHTRQQEWDEQAGGDEEAYVAVDSRCRGCQELAEKQDAVPHGSEGHGVKVALIPAAVHAARQVAAQLTRAED